MIVLGLDLGQSVGWFRGGAVGPCTHGTFAMKKTTDLGSWVGSSDSFFREALDGVDFIAVEQPWLGADYYAARKLVSLLGHVHYWAHHMGIPSSRVIEVPVATGKLTLSGNGRADGPEMIRAAAGHGYPGLNDHESHAMGCWWVQTFGKREPIAKRRTTNGKAVRVAP